MYCALDPATAILEVAVHAGFRVLDTVPHVMTAIHVDPSVVHVAEPEAVPNPDWLMPGYPSADQQSFGDTLLAERDIVVLPSAVAAGSGT